MHGICCLNTFDCRCAFNFVLIRCKVCRYSARFILYVNCSHIFVACDLIHYGAVVYYFGVFEADDWMVIQNFLTQVQSLSSQTRRVTLRSGSSHLCCMVKDLRPSSLCFPQPASCVRTPALANVAVSPNPKPSSA